MSQIVWRMTIKMKFEVELSKLQKHMGKRCPCLIPTETFEPENVCPCKEFVNEGKCRCNLFIEVKE